MLMNPIEKHNLIQFEIANFIESHTGTTASQLVNILNKAATSYYNALLNKADSTQHRPIKRTIIEVSVGKAANDHKYGNVFYSYLSSTSINPKVCISDLISDTPSISVYDTQHHTSPITSIYLDSISNLAIKSMTESDIDFSQYIISYHNEANSLDYQMCVTIYK